MDPIQNDPSSLEAEHEKLRLAADADDAQELVATPTPPSAEQTGGNEDAETDPDRATEPGKPETKLDPDNPDTSTDKLRGPDGKFLKKDEAPPVKPAEQKPTEEKYADKLKKDQERLARNRQEFDLEKAEVRKLADELKQLRQDLSTKPAQPQSQGARFDSQQYSRAAGEFFDRAKKLMAEGDTEGAQEQIKLAEQCQQESIKEAQTEAQTTQTNFAQKWQESARAVIKEVPELGDGNSALAKEMMELLKQEPVLGFMQDGFKRAHEILKLRHDAAEVSGLRDENAKLKTENERLIKLTTPTGVNDSAKHSSRKTEDLPLDEMHKALEREAELADAA